MFFCQRVQYLKVHLQPFFAVLLNQVPHHDKERPGYRRHRGGPMTPFYALSCVDPKQESEAPHVECFAINQALFHGAVVKHSARAALKKGFDYIAPMRGHHSVHFLDPWRLRKRGQLWMLYKKPDKQRPLRRVNRIIAVLLDRVRYGLVQPQKPPEVDIEKIQVVPQIQQFLVQN